MASKHTQQWCIQISAKFFLQQAAFGQPSSSLPLWLPSWHWPSTSRSAWSNKSRCEGGFAQAGGSVGVRHLPLSAFSAGTASLMRISQVHVSVPEMLHRLRFSSAAVGRYNYATLSFPSNVTDHVQEDSLLALASDRQVFCRGEPIYLEGLLPIEEHIGMEACPLKQKNTRFPDTSSCQKAEGMKDCSMHVRKQ
eukprot:1158028-Pelagomonas_calceolata.AAC.3